jgi:hypothetical protein
MSTPLILITEYVNETPKNIIKVNAKTLETAKERVSKEIKLLQQEYPQAKVLRNSQEIATVEIDGKQRIKIEIVSRF